MSRPDGEASDATQRILTTLHWLTMPVAIVGAARDPIVLAPPGR